MRGREKLEAKKKERHAAQLRLMEQNEHNRLQSYAMQRVLEEERKNKETKIQFEK